MTEIAKGEAKEMWYIYLLAIIMMSFLILITRHEIKQRNNGYHKSVAQQPIPASDENDSLITIVDVCFEGYPKRYAYDVNEVQVKEGDYVLVLTHSGIRCGKVVSQPKCLHQNDLSFPPFLLQSIVCTADASDVAYYNTEDLSARAV